MKSYTYIGIFSLVFSLGCIAQTLDGVVDKGLQRNNQAIQGQKKIDSVAKQIENLEYKYRAVLKVNRDLKIYNEQLAKQIKNQKIQKEDILVSLDRSGLIERQIVPLMFKMIDALDNFIRADLPFDRYLRLLRVKEIRELLDRGDVEINEKFRKLSELYQLENSFGRNIDAYKEKITFEGQDLEVNILRVGRISLSFQTDKGDITGAWNRKTKKWEEISSFTYKSAISRGIKVARKQVSPDFIVVPIQKNSTNAALQSN